MTWTDPADAIALFETGDVFTESNFKTYSLDNLLALLHPYAYSPTDVDVVNTVTETILWSQVITGGDMGASGSLELFTFGDFLWNNNTADTLTLRLKFGGSPVMTMLGGTLSSSLSATRQTWYARAYVFNSATNAQTFYVEGRADRSSGGDNEIWALPATAAVDTTVDQTLELTAQWSAASVNDSWRKLHAVLRLAQN